MEKNEQNENEISHFSHKIIQIVICIYIYIYYIYIYVYIIYII